MKDPRPPFTLTEAFAIQNEHLAIWETVLSEDAYMALVRQATDKNMELGLSSPTVAYGVFRGCSMDEFVMNLAHRNFRLQSEKKT